MGEVRSKEGEMRSVERWCIHRRCEERNAQAMRARRRSAGRKRSAHDAVRRVRGCS